MLVYPDSGRFMTPALATPTATATFHNSLPLARHSPVWTLEKLTTPHLPVFRVGGRRTRLPGRKIRKHTTQSQIYMDAQRDVSKIAAKSARWQ